MLIRINHWSHFFVAITIACCLGGQLAAQDSFAGEKAGQEMTHRPWFGTFCWCPPGKFKMGDNVRGDSPPQVDVTLTRGFWIGKYEVTQAQYQFVMGKNPSFHKGSFLPVEMVRWTDANKFCQKLTDLGREKGRLPMGWEYRLPTEAQWEYACRAGATTLYPWGNDASKLNDYAWSSWNSGSEKGIERLRKLDRAAIAKLTVDEAIAISERKSHPVGHKKPNAWGVCDMFGNVSEWCDDSFRRELPGGTDPKVADEGTPRTVRGGSWCWSEGPLRSAVRHSNGVKPELRSNTLGFRVVAVPID